jgi:hypothetical protein
MKSTKKLKFYCYYSSSNDDSKWRLFSKTVTTSRTITSIEEIVFLLNFREGKINAEKWLF